jgi:hypothetical protein
MKYQLDATLQYFISCMSEYCKVASSWYFIYKLTQDARNPNYKKK